MDIRGIHISVDVTKTVTVITSTHNQLTTTMEISSTTPAYTTSEKVTTALGPSTTVHVDGIASKDCYITKYKEIQSWK